MTIMQLRSFLPYLFGTDVTMKSIETIENCSSSAGKGSDPKTVFISLNLNRTSIHNSFL